MKQSIEELRKDFRYEPETGKLFRVRGRYDHLGEITPGRLNIRNRNEECMTTHLIWALHYGVWPTQIVDHKAS